MHLRYRLLYLMLLCFTIVEAQNHFSAQVDAVTNNITVNWHDVQPSQTADYVVYWGTAAGVWTWNSGSVSPPASNNSYTFTPPVDAGASKYYIRIQRNLISGSPELIDFQAVHLKVTVVNPGLAHLAWNTVQNNLKGDYYVERKSTSGWQLLSTVSFDASTLVNDFYLRDTIAEPFCDPAGTDLTFRVRFVINGSSYTESVSNEVTEGPFYDFTDPKDVINDTVSQYADGIKNGIIIGWTQPPGNDIAGYEIQRSEITPSPYNPIAFVPYGTNSYVDESVSACLKNYGYAVVTIDKCGKRSPGTYLSNHRQNILINEYSIDACKRIAHLKWSPYHGMPGGLGGYQILMSEAGKPFQLVATVDSTTLEFNHKGLFKNGLTYKYFIRAISKTLNASSGSCMKISTFVGTELPDSLVITQASVENNKYVKVDFLLYPDNLIKSLQLQRADSREGPYTTVSTLTSNSFIVQDYFINDSTADVNKQSYYYRLAFIDDCSEQAIYSTDTVRTIFCECSETDAGSKVEWNAWEQFDYGIAEYSIERIVGAANTIVASLLPADLSFADNLSAVEPDAAVCYKVTASENAGNPQSPGALSKSNTCCLKRSPKVYVANAFRPYGENNIFKPNSVHMAESNYSMQIYNKWGAVIFETTNKDMGWDGRTNGVIAPLGFYFYIIRYDSMTGESFEKKGHVILLQ